MAAVDHSADDDTEIAHRRKNSLKIALGALGVVYGDIGTSPLYALKEAVRAASTGSVPNAEAVTGAVSIIFWALILVVSLKYAVLILRADNRGEGGVVAMLALLHARAAAPGTWRASLLVVGLIGAALLYGDGAITPAVSVLSAVEGLAVDAPRLEPLVMPVALVILILLFMVQSKGTTAIGRIFGPTMVGWFVVIGILGLSGIAQSPAILNALNPLHALLFMVHAGWAVSFGVLGAAFLAVTGGEAMYADLGHFGRFPIRFAWFAIALPCLTLNYLGQGGLLLADPTSSKSPFFLLAPVWAHYPLVLYATVATVIASQAIISGAFSLTQQSIQLGFLPRMHVKHTASDEIGQIYVGVVNWLLAAATIAAVLIFRTSDNLAGAYGLAVSMLMAITTLLAALVALQWGYSPIAVFAVNGVFLSIDLVFFAANGVKIVEGGWFPLLLAGLVAFLMLTWRKGQIIVEERRAQLRQPEREFLDSLNGKAPTRLSGTAAFLTGSTTGIPLQLTHFMDHAHALHERVVLLTIMARDVPRVPPERRFQMHDLGCGLTRLVMRYGFMEASTCVFQDVQRAVEERLIRCHHAESITFFLGRETIVPTHRSSNLPRWREAIFAFMQRNSERSAVLLGFPANQVVEFGMEIDI